MQLIRRRNGGPAWSRTQIPDDGLALRRGAPGVVEIAPTTAARADAYVARFVESDLRHAALVVAPDTRDLYVGGRRPLDVSVLEERAEIVLGGTRVYFTAREPLAITRYEGDASCAVCGEPAGGCDAIACTNCSAVTHEGALAEGGERLCFTHRGCCPGCQLRRQDFDWTPEDGPDA